MLNIFHLHTQVCFLPLPTLLFPEVYPLDCISHTPLSCGFCLGFINGRKAGERLERRCKSLGIYWHILFLKGRGWQWLYSSTRSQLWQGSTHPIGQLQPQQQLLLHLSLDSHNDSVPLFLQLYHECFTVAYWFLLVLPMPLWIIHKSTLNYSFPTPVHLPRLTVSLWIPNLVVLHKGG